MPVSEKNYEVGDDIDAYCTNCKLNLLHTVASKVEDEVKRTKCNTCNRTHKFRPPKIEKDKTIKEAKVAAPRKKRASSKVSNETKWEELIEKSNIEDAVPYSITESYEPNTLINHKTFGIGYVMEVPVVKRIEVIFRDGIRNLIADR